MATETSVCNQGLLLLGERSLLTSFEETTKNGERCRMYYDGAKKAVFEAYPWPFAKKTVALAKSPDKIDGLNAFKLPQGFARFADKDDEKLYPREGRYLLASDATLTLKYIDFTVEEGLWPGHFEKTLAAYLASELAYGVTESNTKSKQMLDLYEYRLRRARGAIGAVTRHDQSESLRIAHR